MPRARVFTYPRCVADVRTRKKFVAHYAACTQPVNIGTLLSLEPVNFTSKGCWEWGGVRTGSAGYGKYGGVYAHRIACAFRSEPDQPEMLATHSCDNPPCINPSHLLWGDHFSNNTDTVVRNRRNKPVFHWTQTHPEKNPWNRRGSARNWGPGRPINQTSTQESVII